MKEETQNGNIPPGFKLRHIFQGHRGEIYGLAWSPDGKMLASCSGDRTVRLWDFETGQQRHTLKGHSDRVYSIAWLPDRRLISASADTTLIIWDSETGIAVHTLTLAGHKAGNFAVVVTPDERRAISSSVGDCRIWDLRNGELARTISHHQRDLVFALAVTQDGQRVISGASGWTTLGDYVYPHALLVWSLDKEEEVLDLQGHTNWLTAVSLAPDGQTFASASLDRTIRLWDVYTGHQIAVLESHTDGITDVSFSYDGSLLASKSNDNTVRLWRCGTWDTLVIFDEPTGDRHLGTGRLAFHPNLPTLATVDEEQKAIRTWDLDFPTILDVPPVASSIHYINAKVVLLGESGVGKSGLGLRIAENEFRPTESTHGAQFWQIPIPKRVKTGNIDLQVELTLWDLAGQPEYRLIHQLFLDDADVALLLFDCSDATDSFRGVPYWAKVLRKQAPPHAVRFLVSARTDVSPVTVDDHEINRKLAEYGLNRHFRTSAATGEGVSELKQQILESIPWEQLSHTTTPRLFQVIREFLLERKEAGSTILAVDKVQREVYRRYTGRKAAQAEVDTVIRLLQARGLVFRLELPLGPAQVLLKPELINQYASSIIQAARNHPCSIGAISERDVLTANLPFIGFKRLRREEERIVLESTVELLIRHDLCFRQMGLLVFPSQINVTRPVPTEQIPPSEVTYQFSGAVETIYASLVVRLSYTDYFQREDHWKYAAEFSREAHRLGFAIRQVEEGTGELDIYFHPGVSEFDRVTFVRFITDHLRTKGIDIRERIRLYCSHCGEEVENLDAIERRVQAGKLDIPCQYCDASVIIPRSIEERYRSDRSYIEKQQQMVNAVRKRTKQEVQAFKTDRQQYIEEEGDLIHILYVSDIHLGKDSEARKYRTQLETDLKRELDVNRLEYLIISGDVANYSTKEEYNAAFELVDGLVKHFGLDSSRVVVVPGNHDLNWDLSEDAYPFVAKRKLPEQLSEGRYIPAGEPGALVRDEDLYRERFAYFSSYFYKKVYSGQEYPSDYVEQGILHLCPDDRLLFLALNSAWEIDHHYQDRASINMDALSCALDRLQDDKYDDWLKIAVWHHPVTGREAMNDEFLQLLSVHGFQICMHGHVHEAQQGFYTYDSSRGLHIIGAGTFGVPLRKQAGIPLQYNLLTLDPETRKLTVETRKKEKPDGAWSADARWGDKNNPVPRYTIQLK
jgi:small GTP-binding protein